MSNKILEAYETLLDPERRRRYDSTLEFNEAIPEKFNPEKDDFFEIFDPVFRRNAYFSKITPVPLLGGPTDSIKRVLQFYDFWDNFDTWREFVHEEEYDLSQAENRYERRYMEQQNRRLKAPLLKNEKLRLNKLVNLAYQNDPRIKAMILKQEEEKLARKKEKQAMKEAKRLQEQTRLEKIKEAQKLEEEQLRQKEQQDKEMVVQRRKDRRENEKLFRRMFKDKIDDAKYDDYYIDELLFKMQDDDLDNLLKFMNTHIKINPYDLEENLRLLKSSKLENQKINQVDKAPKEEKTEIEWTVQEISLLTKGVSKFPPGTQDRWKRIAFYIGGRFTESQVLEKAKALKSKHKNDLALKIPNYINLKAEPLKEEAAAKQEVNKVEPKEQNSVLSWSQEQQSQLEAAMKKYPATVPMKERWEQIASEVSNKTMKECVERFKWIKEQLKPKVNN